MNRTCSQCSANRNYDSCPAGFQNGTVHDELGCPWKINGWDVEWKPSGLRWSLFNYHWMLHGAFPERGTTREYIGWISDERNHSAQSYVARCSYDGEEVGRGTLHECARALVRRLEGTAS